MKAIFFSDAHLLDNEAHRTGAIKDFMRHAAADADMIFILGDLFEFYHGYEGYVYPFYRDMVDLLKELAAGKKAAYFVEGNHEFGMGRFFESYTGIRCVKEVALHLDEKKVYVAHGDAIRLLQLGPVLKSRFIYSIMDLLGPMLTWRIAMWSRIVLSKKHKPYRQKVVNRFRSYAEEKLRQGYDAVVLAHSHMADLVEYEQEGKKKTYMNTGDLIASFTYGTYISDKGFSLHTYDRRLP